MVHIVSSISFYIRPSSDGTYYGMVIGSVRLSVRVSVRQSKFSALFSYMLWHIELKILHVTFFLWTFDQVRVSSIFDNFCWSYAPFETKKTGNTQFSALFSYILWHIRLKFCTWLYFAALQIKCECRQFPSICIGGMPLLKLRILQIHSFPQFSPQCFDTLGWNFAHGFILLYYSSSLSVVNFRQFFVGVMPLLEFGLLEIHSFPHFSPTCFYIHVLSWNLHMTLFYFTTDQVQVSSISVNFL